MNLNCLLSDAIARINNAKANSYLEVRVLASKKVFSILKILQEKKIIEKIEAGDRFLTVHLWPEGGFRKLKIISTPGRVFHVAANRIPIDRMNDIRIISTSSGVMTTGEAKEKNIGGKMVLQVFLQ